MKKLTGDRFSETQMMLVTEFEHTPNGLLS